MWKMGIRNSFTLEATFCGSTLGSKRGTHFNTKDLESMGYHFCDSLLDYCDPDRSKYYQCLKELEEMEKHMNVERVLEDSDTSLVEISVDLESSSRGSDSSESNDAQTYLLKLTSQMKAKKKYLKTKRERNATLANRQNAKEVCGKTHLLQRHEESNSDVKDTKPNVPDAYMGDYFRRLLPNQGLVKIPGQTSYPQKKISSSQGMSQSLNKDQQRSFLETCKRPTQETVQLKGIDMYRSCFKVSSLNCPMNKLTPSWIEKTRIPADSHHRLKSKVKRYIPAQGKKMDTNWTDDEKRIHREKRIAHTQEILQYLLPIVETAKNRESVQMKGLFNPRTTFQLQNQLTPTACINIRRYNTSWTPSRNLPFKTQKNLVTNASAWFPSVPERSFQSLSLLHSLKMRKNYCQTWAKKTEIVKPPSGKLKAAPSSSKQDADVAKGKGLQPKEPNLKSCEQIFPHLTKTNHKEPNENDEQLTYHLKSERDS